MPKFNGEEVEILRPAQQGDPGFDASKDLVVIKKQDGSTTTAERSAIEESGPAGTRAGSASPSDGTSTSSPSRDTARDSGRRTDENR